MSRLATTCFLLLVAQSSFAQASQQLTPAEILARVSSTYASCRTYSDEGATSTIMSLNQFGAGNSRAMIETFSTQFVRPDAFRFQFYVGRVQMNRTLIAWKAGQVEKSYVFDRRTEQDQLSGMLISMFYESHGTAVRVPALLMPQLFFGKGLFASLTDLKLGPEDKIDRHRAFKIEARLENSPFNLWIDANQFLILQVEQVTTLGRVTQYTTTRYRPVLNAEIAPAKLAFNAPGKVYPDDAPATPASGSPELKSNVRPRLKDFGSSINLTAEENERLRKQQERSDDEDVVKVNTDLVVSDVLVVDVQGRTIPDLGAKDFVIKEDGQPQEIESLSLGNSDQVPRTIVLIMDYSNSELPYIITSVDAAKTLVDKLKRRDRMALVTDDVQLLVDFTSDKAVLKAQLDELKERAMKGQLGRSLQYDALMATLTELFNREEERPIVIFQTDGDELDALGKIPPAELRPYVTTKFSFEDLLTAAERDRVTIYSIIPGVQMIGFSGNALIQRAKLDWENRMKAQQQLRRIRHQPEMPANNPTDDDFFLQNAERWNRLHLGVVQLAIASGGWADYLEKPEQADRLYAHVLDDINQRYVISYYPKNRTRDGQRRKVSIEVRGHPEYRILGRRSYFAPQP